MPNKPDLSLHTLTHFLDRFVFRNPSTRKITRGHSIMQPLPGAGSGIKGIIVSIRDTGRTQQRMNSDQFWTKKVQDVAPDEVFFHKYFTHRGVEARKKSTRATGSSGVEQEEKEHEIWSAMVDSQPDLIFDDEQADMDYMSLTDLSGVDCLEGAIKIPRGTGCGGSDSDFKKQNRITLNSIISGSQKKRQDSSFLGGTSSRLQSEGSDTWESEDESEMWSDTDVDLESTPTLLERDGSSTTLLQGLEKTMVKRGKIEIADTNDKDVRIHKKQKLKHLPTFASAEDYADLILE